MDSLELLAAKADAEQFKAQQRASKKPEPPDMVSVVGREDGVLLVNRGGAIMPATNNTTAGLGIGETVAQGEGTYLEVISPEPFRPQFPVFPLVVQRRRFGGGNIIPFIYGVPHTFDYTYAPGGVAQEITSASQWLFSRDLQQVPINCVSFIEIKYSGARLEQVVSTGLDKTCSSFTAFWYQRYAALAAAIRNSNDGASPGFFYSQLNVTECEPPPGPTKNGQLLHNATFIERTIRVGPLDNFLTYTESASHGNGGSNSSASFFTTASGDGDPDAAWIDQEDFVIHPNELLDEEDQNPAIQQRAKNKRSGNSMIYAWTLASSIESISGNGVKEVGAAWPRVASQPIPDNTPLNELSQSELDEFNSYGIDPFTEQFTLSTGGGGYSSVSTTQIPIQRINGKPYIASHAAIDFIGSRQEQQALPALGPITPLPPDHDYRQAYLNLPYRAQGLGDWVLLNDGNVDQDGYMLAHPLKMPASMANRLRARNVSEISTVAHAFCNLIGGPPTLLIPHGDQAYCYQAWAQNSDDPANIFWELRDVDTGDPNNPNDFGEASLDWRFPMQNSQAEFAGPCESELYENRFINIHNGTAYEVTPSALTAVLANAGTEAIAVPFTGKALGVDNGACSIGAASGLSKSFPAIDSIDGAEVLAAAPNRVTKQLAAPTAAPAEDA